MKEITALVSRNRKLFFKDKGMLFSSMITPVILIVLYATFLANVYKDSFVSATKDMIDLPDKIINGTVAAQLAAALLAVSCVTVTFCVNLTMVQDRASGARKDFDVSPVSKTKIYIGYFLSTVLNSLMVNGTALALCLLYILKMGWYMSASDVIFVILDMILLVLFGSTLSSIVSYPLKTQGQLSAVGTIVSAGYGFVCGAYMPISNFDDNSLIRLTSGATAINFLFSSFAASQNGLIVYFVLPEAVGAVTILILWSTFACSSESTMVTLCLHHESGLTACNAAFLRESIIY
jgi:multidrug/hemolysin transport system permease protein